MSKTKHHMQPAWCWISRQASRESHYKNILKAKKPHLLRVSITAQPTLGAFALLETKRGRMWSLSGGKNCNNTVCIGSSFYEETSFKHFFTKPFCKVKAIHKENLCWKTHYKNSSRAMVLFYRQFSVVTLPYNCACLNIFKHKTKTKKRRKII